MKNNDYIKLNLKAFNEPVNDPTKKQRADFALRYIGKNKRILDVGCANGELSRIIKEHGNYIIGLDILKEHLDFAKKNCNEVVLSNVTKLPFQEKNFDAVFAGELIEHLSEEDLDKFLEETKRVLKDDGLLIITTPNPDFIKLKLRGITKEKMITGAHVTIYSLNELKKKLTSHDFNIIAKNGLGKMGFLISTKIPILSLYGDYGIVSRVLR
jgi:2-polyprenyl-3-methyl-5-hydroxy-6-metoxy-1,4-benzoquinol methylase